MHCVGMYSSTGTSLFKYGCIRCVYEYLCKYILLFLNFFLFIFFFNYKWGCCLHGTLDEQSVMPVSSTKHKMVYGAAFKRVNLGGFLFCFGFFWSVFCRFIK